MSGDGPSTPIHSTGTYPLFVNGAREFAEALEAVGTGDALLMAGEMRWYEESFKNWSPTNRPSEEDRRRIIAEFLAAAKRVQELLQGLLSVTK